MRTILIILVYFTVSCHKTAENKEKIAQKIPQKIAYTKKTSQKNIPPKTPKKQINFSMKLSKKTILMNSGMALVAYYTIANLSNVSYKNLWVKSNLPANLKLTNSTPKSISKKSLKWKLPKLAAKEKIVLKAHLRLVEHGWGSRTIHGMLTINKKQWHAKAKIYIV